MSIKQDYSSKFIFILYWFLFNVVYVKYILICSKYITSFVVIVAIVVEEQGYIFHHSQKN